MAFAITANFLLGTYQGSDSGGRPEPYPSPDRLYKACVAAAYNTFDFERQTDDRVLTDEQIKSFGRIFGICLIETSRFTQRCHDQAGVAIEYAFSKCNHRHR